MSAKNGSSKRRGGRKPEFPGLGKDAEALGVSRYFLWKCLKGYAVSKPLMARLQELKRQQQEATS